MKVTSDQVWQATDALKKLMEEPWPVKTAYRLAKLARKLGGAHKDIEQVRADLVKRYGTSDSQGYKVNPECPGWSEFAVAYNELMSQETEIDWGPVDLPVDGDQTVSPAVLMALEPFVTVGGDS